MSPKKDKKPKIKKIDEAEIFALARKREAAAKAEAKGKKDKTDADKVLIEQILEARGLGSLESSQHGPFTRITVVTGTDTVYRGEEMFQVLKPAQRRAAYDAQVNLNALSSETRKKILEMIPKAELAEVTSHTLNVDKLSLAVQNDVIDAKVVAKYTDLIDRKPYVRISHGAS